MIDLLSLQKQFISAHLSEGDTAADFTMGNGHDTSFLSRTVGASGRVFSFDIQPDALVSTRATLEKDGAPDNVTLICDSHHNCQKYISAPIKAGMFNLGYLPGGNKSLTTKRETTLPAIRAALELLAADGILLIAVYPGHEEGRLEGEAIMAELATLDRRKICITQIKILNSPTSPYFIMAEKK